MNPRVNEESVSMNPSAVELERFAALERENEQLRIALVSRVVIEQAKGVLAERLALSLDEAFALLRRAARSNRRQIHALAADVVGSRQTPAEIAELMQHRPHDAADLGADARSRNGASSAARRQSETAHHDR